MWSRMAIRLPGTSSIVNATSGVGEENRPGSELVGRLHRQDHLGPGMTFVEMQSALEHQNPFSQPITQRQATPMAGDRGCFQAGNIREWQSAKRRQTAHHVAHPGAKNQGQRQGRFSARRANSVKVAVAVIAAPVTTPRVFDGSSSPRTSPAPLARSTGHTIPRPAGWCSTPDQSGRHRPIGGESACG